MDDEEAEKAEPVQEKQDGQQEDLPGVRQAGQQGVSRVFLRRLDGSQTVVPERRYRTADEPKEDGRPQLNSTAVRDVELGQTDAHEQGGGRKDDPQIQTCAQDALLPRRLLLDVRHVEPHQGRIKPLTAELQSDLHDRHGHGEETELLSPQQIRSDQDECEIQQVPETPPGENDQEIEDLVLLEQVPDVHASNAARVRASCR